MKDFWEFSGADDEGNFSNRAKSIATERTKKRKRMESSSEADDNDVSGGVVSAATKRSDFADRRKKARSSSSPLSRIGVCAQSFPRDGIVDTLFYGRDLTLDVVDSAPQNEPSPATPFVGYFFPPARVFCFLTNNKKNRSLRSQDPWVVWWRLDDNVRWSWLNSYYSTFEGFDLWLLTISSLMWSLSLGAKDHSARTGVGAMGTRHFFNGCQEPTLLKLLSARASAGGRA